MMVSEDERKVLMDVFENDETLYDLFLDGKLDILSKGLIDSLDGSLEQVEKLEERTNKVLSAINKNKLSKSVENKLVSIIVGAYGTLLFNMGSAIRQN